jgi:solute carrier family 35 protein
MQTSTLLQKRGPGDIDRLGVAAALADTNVAEASLFHGVPQEPGFNVANGIHTNEKRHRTTWEVLGVCVAVIVLTAIGWFAFWLRIRNGERMPNLKLSLLMASFGICSWGMNVVNKALVISLGAPTLITASQMTLSAVGVICVAYNRIGGDPKQMFKWCVVPCLYCAMLVSSFYTFKYLTLSMLMIIRNTGPMITLPIEVVVMAPEKSPYVKVQMLLALCVILAGVCVYNGNITVPYYGIALAFANMVLAVADRVAQRRLLTTECQGLPTETCMLLNNIVGLAPCFILAYVWGEFANLNWKQWFLSHDTFLLLLSGIILTGICYFAISVQREISATSFMVLQNVVRIAVVCVGVIIFSDPLGWPWQVIGCGLSFIGALWYGKAQVDGSAQKAMDDKSSAEEQMQSSDAEKKVSDEAGSEKEAHVEPAEAAPRKGQATSVTSTRESR